MKKLLGISTALTGAFYFLLGVQTSADNWTTADRILAGVFTISLVGLLTMKRTAK